jgi:hypothetical protein
MQMLDAVQLLKDKGFSFYWNDADKHWWLTKPGKSGKITRTEPVLANNRENAEAAAVNRYVKGISN